MKNLLLKVSAILFVVCVFIENTQAQSAAKVWSFGPEVGASFAKYGMDRDDTDYNTGLVLGGFLTYSIENIYAFTGKILFSQKGATYQIGGTEIKDHLNYLEVPLLARGFFNREGSVRPNIFVGPSFGFLQSVKMKIGNGDYEDMVYVNGNDNYKDVYNSFDFGIAAGLGLNIKVANEMYFIVDVRYTHGLSDVWIASENVNNQVVAITGALSFGL